MKLRKSLCVLLITLSSAQIFGGTARADEGLWTFNNIPREEIKRRYGYEITDAWLRKVQLASVRFNDGASGSFVSPDGLVFTNHHVAADTLQKLSAAGKDYHQNGFYARTRAEELKAPNLELNVLVEIQDVTARVNESVKAGITAAEANNARQAEIANIEKESLTATKLRSDVVSLYRGGQYHLYRYKAYTDVRLVFAPEFAVAFFGGDPDNYSYPKYSLDIAFFRVYENDQPLKVENYFEFSRGGAKQNELVFTSGHPGSTARLNTVAHLEFLRDSALLFSLRRLSKQRETLRAYSMKGEEQSRRAREDLFDAENILKRTRGQHAGLLDKSLMAKKSQAENTLRRKIATDPEKQKEYGMIWQEIAAGRKELQRRFLEISFLESAAAFDTTLFNYARTIVRLTEEKTKANAERLSEYTDARLTSLELNLFSTAPIYKDLEKIKLAGSLSFMRDELGAANSLVKKILNGKTPQARANELIDGTQLDDADYRRQLVAGGLNAVKDSTDPMIVLAKAIDPESRAIRKFYEPILGAERANYGKLSRALYELEGTSLYPDATFTLRLSYGAVKGYREKNKQVPPFTTLGGMFQRAAQHQNRSPFKLPERWLEKKASLNLNLPLNFVSTNETIGGSSGSPVFNKELEIVGVVFDGNTQSLVGHFVYDGTQGRAISVDTRGIMEALLKIYDASEIANEMRK